VLSPINGTYYTGPHLGYGSICLCNSVYYSLLSACAYCQGGSIRLWVRFKMITPPMVAQPGFRWSDHSSNCTRTYIGWDLICWSFIVFILSSAIRNKSHLELRCQPMRIWMLPYSIYRNGCKNHHWLISIDRWSIQCDPCLPYDGPHWIIKGTPVKHTNRHTDTGFVIDLFGRQ